MRFEWGWALRGRYGWSSTTSAPARVHMAAPHQLVDHFGDEPHAAVAKQHVAAPRMLADHLIDVTEGSVGRMDDRGGFVFVVIVVRFLVLVSVVVLVEVVGTAVDVDLRGGRFAVGQGILGVAQVAAPGTMATQVESLCEGVCSPRKTVWLVPSVMSLMRMRLLRNNGPLAIRLKSDAGFSQTAIWPALAT